MQGEIIALWITSSATAIGVIVTIVKYSRNNKRVDVKDAEERAEELTGMKKDIGHIKSKIDDPESGLTAIKTAVLNQQLHCTKVSTAISAQVETNSRDIESLKNRRKR